MALLLDIENSIVGMGFNNSYAIVGSIAGDKRSIQVKILYYLSQEARDKGYQPVRYDVYSIALDDLDTDKTLFSSIYCWLKNNVPIFSQAKDC